MLAQSNGCMEKLMSEIGEYVQQLFAETGDGHLHYHNFSHTMDVVNNSLEIARHYPLSGLDLQVLITAAWFHDTGHLFGTPAGHEEKSVLLMRNYFKDKNKDNAFLNQVENAILCTRLSYKPTSLIEEILCDADLFHLGTDQFFSANEKVRAEMESRTNSLFPNWLSTTWIFMKEHHYFTGYCQQLLGEQKARNIAVVEKQILEAQS
ncbi:MAG: metal-dependent phosphohydrolase [Ferruginibacter sp.]|nr:metal-dependent phosphohydrolase [Ferruginibacter sp.]